MTLLQSGLIDVLKPEKDIFPYYELFLSRYSLITVTAIVSQVSLLPETYKDTTKEEMDKEIDGMIEGLPKTSVDQRNKYRIWCIGALVDPGEIVQENEKRTFASELFYEDAKKYSLSNREMILRGLNTSTFLNYFFLIEDSLKNIYINLVNPENKFIKGSETISTCLVQIISEINIRQKFEEELYARSKFFFNMKALEVMWSLLNLIRNQIAHANGFYDDKAKGSFNQRMKKLIEHYGDNDDCLLSLSMIIEVFERHKEQIKETGYLIVDNSLENIIRNISIFIMESLYVCEYDKIKINQINKS